MATRKSFDKERWEAMTGMEMSQLLPECENPESAGEVTDHAGNEILPTVTEQSGIQEPAEKDGSAPVGVSRKVNYIKIANNTPKVGEKIYTIGSPRGLDNTFSSGEISQIRENGKILQISAPIDHGSSGGVLLNSKGEAVGITSGGIDDSGANLNYAWNIQLIKSYIP